MSATKTNSEIYGHAPRVYPDGLHIRRSTSGGTRGFEIWNGTERVKGIAVIPNKQDAELRLDAEKMMRANIGPEWGYL